MHRDTQIGLAMAIVLIGFAAALGLPREPRETLATSPLSDAAALDARVNELPVRAYTEPQAARTPPGDRSTPPNDVAGLGGGGTSGGGTGRSGTGGGGTGGTETGPAPVSSSAGSGDVLNSGSPAAAGAPTPAVGAAPAAPSQPAGPPPIADTATATEVDRPGGKSTRSLAGPADTSPAAGSESEADLVHVVREGDTLSELARRYLGSVARYPEIFEANRDQLRSPDDLRLHQRLRIPRRGPVAAGRQ